MYMIKKWVNKMIILTIDEIKERVQPILAKYGLNEVYLFGSYSRGQATEVSDVDLAFVSDRTLSYFEIFEIEEELEKVLGKSVELVPMDQLSEVKTPIGQYMYQNQIQKERQLIS